MSKAFNYVKYQMVNFKLNMCCWLAPVRVGLIINGYLNITIAVISLLAVADDSFTTILMQVQDAILGDNAKKPIPVLSYCAELSFNVILISALYRKDIPLLRMYQRYCIVAAVTSVMVYSMVVAAIGIIVGMVLILSILYQVYVIILVRSMIVEMKLEKKKLELPTVVMSSLIHQEPKEVKVVTDVEAPSDSDSDDDKSEAGEKKDRLETVAEHPKEESNSEDEKSEVKEKK